MKYFIPLNFHLLLKPKKKKKKLSLRILHHKNFIIIMHPTSPIFILQTLDKIWNLALEELFILYGWTREQIQEYA